MKLKCFFFGHKYFEVGKSEDSIENAIADDTVKNLVCYRRVLFYFHCIECENDRTLTYNFYAKGVENESCIRC